MFVDVTLPIRAGAVFRPGTAPVEIYKRKFHSDSGAEFQTTMLSLPAHTATHIDLVSKSRDIVPERMISRGKLFDVTRPRGDQISLSDLKVRTGLQPGDTVLFRTGWSDFVGEKKYYEHPELAPEVLEWLILSKVNAVGIDSPGLGRERLHGEYDRLLAENDILVIENLTNLRAVTCKEFMVYCFPLSIENIDAVPARVLIEINGMTKSSPL
ncbi:MAG: hypothetical protein GXO91_05080 [FCB group bacterium]|nr:hypothetical protein [FCB group bacterium]